VTTEPFFVPLGDEVLLRSPGSLQFTDAICRSAGGPSQTVQGHVWLTHDHLAFRPNVGMPHPQSVTLKRDSITGATCVFARRFGLFRASRPRLEVCYRYAYLTAPTPHVFEVDSPERWADAIGGARRIQTQSARQLVQGALRDGERERGRYTTALEQISFPRGFWHTEDAEGRDEVLSNGLKDLGINVPSNFLAKLDLDVQVETGPEDYETGPGSEEWGRREQIRCVCEAINARNGSNGEQRFYEYAEDLPGWPSYFEPLWLWLSEAEDAELRRLGIVGAKPNGDAG